VVVVVVVVVEGGHKHIYKRGKTQSAKRKGNLL
jgi:hypothetical protein